MERLILHSDANSFYASVECLYDPDIRDKPVAVCGDPKHRHGIVLAANRIAKKMGVKTGMAVWQAKEACPLLVAVPPDYSLYLHFSKMLRGIYNDYSDRVESFGLDEAWVDISQRNRTFKDAEHIANEIRERVKFELGITVSVGVSFNKVLAKLGSDMKKPDATTVIPRDGFREIIGGLSVSDLLYVGPSTTRKLMDRCIRTIGDLARADTEMIRLLLGKNGLILKAYAQGWDVSPVMPVDAEAAIKSIGNSTTPPHDIETLDDARCLYYMLAESISARLRENGFRAQVISISARTTDLVSGSCQQTIKVATNLTHEIADTAMELFMRRFASKLPYRSVGINCGTLVPEAVPVQYDMFGNWEKRDKAERLERAIDGLRYRFGHQVLQRGVVLMDRQYAAINPKEEHTIHPAQFYAG